LFKRVYICQKTCTIFSFAPCILHFWLRALLLVYRSPWPVACDVRCREHILLWYFECTRLPCRWVYSHVFFMFAMLCKRYCCWKIRMPIYYIFHVMCAFHMDGIIVKVIWYLDSVHMKCTPIVKTYSTDESCTNPLSGTLLCEKNSILMSTFYQPMFYSLYYMRFG
jgi:hypothetical protein